jgi:hypothetical protein
MPYEHLTLVAHTDWSSGQKKRWLAQALRQPDGSFRAETPVRAGGQDSFLASLRAAAGPGGCALAGFDFPIGLPQHYAEITGVNDFLTFLPKLGSGEWSLFYLPAASLAEISPFRPFYPARPGSSRHAHLIKGLEAGSIDQLRRKCELAHPNRRAACPLFWTLGGQQAGKAAISGWREILAPGLTSDPPQLSLWPFSGPLHTLLQPGSLVVAECYPGEYYSQLGLAFSRPKQGARSGKRVQEDRRRNAPALLAWAGRVGVSLSPTLQADIQDGFGPDAEGEDRFDSVVGLFGMLNVLLGCGPPGEPQAEALRKIEGWILGQECDL